MVPVLMIVGLGGSLAETSRSRAGLQVALEGAASAGAETMLLDLREHPASDVGTRLRLRRSGLSSAASLWGSGSASCSATSSPGS